MGVHVKIYLTKFPCHRNRHIPVRPGALFIRQNVRQVWIQIHNGFSTYPMKFRDQEGLKHSVSQIEDVDKIPWGQVMAQ